MYIEIKDRAIREVFAFYGSSNVNNELGFLSLIFPFDLACMARTPDCGERKIYRRR